MFIYLCPRAWIWKKKKKINKSHIHLLSGKMDTPGENFFFKWQRRTANWDDLLVFGSIYAALPLNSMCFSFQLEFQTPSPGQGIRWPSCLQLRALFTCLLSGDPWPLSEITLFISLCSADACCVLPLEFKRYEEHMSLFCPSLCFQQVEESACKSVTGANDYISLLSKYLLNELVNNYFLGGSNCLFKF